MSRLSTKLAVFVSTLLLVTNFASSSSASANPINAAAFDTFVNIDCYYFSTGDEGVSLKAVGLDYSPNLALDVYFYVTGPSAFSASGFTEHSAVNSSNNGPGSWTTPTIYKITGSNSGFWEVEVKVYSQFGIIGTDYDSTSC